MGAIPLSKGKKPFISEEELIGLLIKMKTEQLPFFRLIVNFIDFNINIEN